MKILIAPLHYWYEDQGGEVGWAYEFLNSLTDVDVMGLVANPKMVQPEAHIKVQGFSSKKYKTGTL